MYGTGSEDMDTLTFNSPIILRHLTFSEARKMPIDVIKLDVALEGLALTMDQVRAIRSPSGLTIFLSGNLYCSLSISASFAAATISSH